MKILNIKAVNNKTITNDFMDFSKLNFFIKHLLS